MKQYRITGIKWNTDIYRIEVADHRTHEQTEGAIDVESVFYKGVEIPFDMHEGNESFHKEMYKVAHRAIADFVANNQSSNIPISQLDDETNWLTVETIQPITKQDDIDLADEVQHVISGFSLSARMEKLNGHDTLLHDTNGNL